MIITNKIQRKYKNTKKFNIKIYNIIFRNPLIFIKDSKKNEKNYFVNNRNFRSARYRFYLWR
jgi:hypothetical protein